MNDSAYFGIAALVTAAGTFVTAIAAAVVLLRRMRVIHDLVNSDMTAALQAGLDASRGQLVLLRRAIEADQAAGIEPEPTDLGALVSLDARVKDLEQTLSGRVRQQAAAIMDAAQKGHADDAQ